MQPLRRRAWCRAPLAACASITAHHHFCPALEGITMNPVRKFPGFFVNVFTFGIARARWISHANRALGHRTGFWFAWLLQAFAFYGTAKRLNVALAAAGSSHRESPFWCFWLTGFPFIGTSRKMRRGFRRLNDAWAVQARAAAVVDSAAPAIASGEPEAPVSA
jgi:hypothetical protein